MLGYLTDRPEMADWLSSEEKDWLVNRLATERLSRGGASPISIFAALTNRTIWHLGIIFLFAAIGFYGYSFWAPLVVKSLIGASDFGVGLILGAISAVTIILMLLNSAHSDHTDERRLHVAISLLISGAGFFGCAVLQEPILALVFLALVPIGHCAAYGPFWSMPVSVPHWSACGRGDRASGDNRERRRPGWSYSHRRIEGSFRNARSRIYAAWWMRSSRGAALDGSWTGFSPA